MFRRKRQIKHEDIGSPMEFVHVDGNSFVNQKVINLDEARYYAVVERLKKSAASITSIVVRRHKADQPRLLVSHKCDQKKIGLNNNTKISTPMEIGTPFNFVHVSHVGLASSPVNKCAPEDAETQTKNCAQENQVNSMYL